MITPNCQEQVQINSAESDKCNEGSAEVRKPLIKVKPEFSIKTFEKNLENSKKLAEEASNTLVIHCYQSNSGVFRIENSATPFVRKKCDITIKKLSDLNNFCNEPVITKEKQILPKTPINDEKEVDVLNGDILSIIREILLKHSLTDHNYNRVDFLQKIGVTERRWNDTQIMHLIARLRKLVSPMSTVDKTPQEELIARNLMHELEYLLQLRARRKIEMSHIKAKAGMLGGSTKRTINSTMRIENFLNIKLECPDDSEELTSQNSSQYISSSKRPYPDQERNVNAKKPFITSILKKSLPNAECITKHHVLQKSSPKKLVNHENRVITTVKKLVRNENKIITSVKKLVPVGNIVKKPIHQGNNFSNIVKKPVLQGNSDKNIVKKNTYPGNVSNLVKKPIHQTINVKKAVSQENNVNNTVKKPVHQRNIVKKPVVQENIVQKSDDQENIKKPLDQEKIVNKPVKEENNIKIPDQQENNVKFNKISKSKSKLEKDKPELLHTCKKPNKRRGKHRYVGKIGYWSRVKGGTRKKNCAACLKNKK